MPLMRALLSWAFYDFANTIFSAVVLTAFFPLYFTSLVGSKWQLGAANTAAMILAALAVPLLGALSDQTGKTRRYLTLATLAAILFQSLLGGFTNPPLLLTFYLLGCLFFHASLVFYNSLLPVVADTRRQGFASGLGTGLGYLAVVLVLPLMGALEKKAGTQIVFPASAGLFLLFSLPLFFWVPERKAAHPKKFRWGLWQDEWRRVLQTVKHLPSVPVLALFLGGNFFIVDAMNAMIIWVAVYVREVFDPGQDAILMLLMLLNASAFLAGILSGWLTDRAGAFRILIASALVLTGTLLILVRTESFEVFRWAAVGGGAAAIAGIWTSGRKVLIELAPRERLGEYFGLYGLTTKISILGSLMFAILADFSGMRQALGILLFPAGAGCLLLIFSRTLQERTSP